MIYFNIEIKKCKIHLILVNCYIYTLSRSFLNMKCLTHKL